MSFVRNTLGNNTLSLCVVLLARLLRTRFGMTTAGTDTAEANRTGRETFQVTAYCAISSNVVDGSSEKFLSGLVSEGCSRYSS